MEGEENKEQKVEEEKRGKVNNKNIIFIKDRR
jgi:hypothetical protein